jgi:hypothetical protein
MKAAYGPREGQRATGLFRGRIFGVELRGVARISEAVAQGVGPARIRQPKQQREQNAILLPNLLPNALGRAGKETDEERWDTQRMPTDQVVQG